MSVGLKRFLAKHCRPYFISVEPANFCQLHCPQCPVGLREISPSKRLLSIPDAQRLFRHIPVSVRIVQFYFQGEPLLNRDLPAIIRMAHQAGRYTTLSTNAQALTQDMASRLVASGLNRIIISIDGLSEKSYSTYRQGGSLKKALEGLQFLHEAKAHTGAHLHIELQCLRLRSNGDEWSLFEREYKNLGADSLTFKTAQFYDYEQGNPLMPTDSQYARYLLGQDGKYHLKKRRWICRRVLSGCVIDVEGNVLPCCFDKDRRFILGNIFEQTLDKIWHSNKAVGFREQVLTNRTAFAMCSNCTE